MEQLTSWAKMGVSQSDDINLPKQEVSENGDKALVKNAYNLNNKDISIWSWSKTCSVLFGQIDNCNNKK